MPPEGFAVALRWRARAPVDLAVGESCLYRLDGDGAASQPLPLDRRRSGAVISRDLLRCTGGIRLAADAQRDPQYDPARKGAKRSISSRSRADVSKGFAGAPAKAGGTLASPASPPLFETRAGFRTARTAGAHLHCASIRR
mgnify:CR=1 FL=1